MSYGTMTMDGRVFVLVPKPDFDKLVRRSPLPDYPTANRAGNMPALAASRVSIARTIITRRGAVGLTQKALATAAGVRIETMNRVEKGKVTPDTKTLVKIEKALTKAEATRAQSNAS